MVHLRNGQTAAARRRRRATHYVAALLWACCVRPLAAQTPDWSQPSWGAESPIVPRAGRLPTGAQPGVDPYQSGRFAHPATSGHAGTGVEWVYDEQHEPSLPTHETPFLESGPALDWTEGLRVMPGGLLYRSYVAGVKEPKFSAVWLNDPDHGLIWETSLGGRIGVLRYGDPNSPAGAWQLDLEGAVFARVDPEENSDLEAADFRIGALLTGRSGPWAGKVGYYHVSSHLGDEFLLKHPMFPRLNYVRDSLLLGTSYDVARDLRIYTEMGYAVGHEGGALPLEFQAGAEFNPVPRDEFIGAPFAAINGHVREDFDYTSSLNLIAGWQWRGRRSNQTYRVGVQYYSGPSLQYSFVNQHEELLGFGLWVDY